MALSTLAIESLVDRVDYHLMLKDTQSNVIIFLVLRLHFHARFIYLSPQAAIIHVYLDNMH